MSGLIRQLLIFILITLAVCVFGFHGCEEQNTCSACIGIPECAWCAQPDGESRGMQRCKNKALITEAWCSPRDVINPDTNVQIRKNNQIRTGANPVQIQPQIIQLILRKNEEQKIDFIYQQTEDEPVDLYYLIASSMANDKDNLSALGDELGQVMKNLTNNFRLGFGIFMDKSGLPHLSTMSQRENCSAPCDSRYSYINHMSLTMQTELFSKKVRNADLSGNLNNTEGGLDAIMQALVCTEEIGWRPKARKLLLLSPDAGFHVTGDDKLAGIIEPNDEQCHLDSNGYYTHASMTDYPSISQIDKQARENNINIIFAVTEKRANEYNFLKDRVHGAVQGSLNKDSSNLVDLVKTEYEKLMNSISITDNAGGSVQIQYYSKCLSDETKQTNECGNIRGRPKIHFTAAIKALDCPKNKTQWKQTIEIRPGNLDQRLTIDLEVICQCPCETTGEFGFEVNSIKCNRRGNLQCGICACDNHSFGSFCECHGEDLRVMGDETSNCREVAAGEICSGRGECSCGRCKCDERPGTDENIYGNFCECDDFTCDRYRGVLCTGPENGRCECGICICNPGWSGRACNCRISHETCIQHAGMDICSGHGNCVCGACECYQGYSGIYCEVQSTLL